MKYHFFLLANIAAPSITNAFFQYVSPSTRSVRSHSHFARVAGGTSIENEKQQLTFTVVKAKSLDNEDGDDTTLVMGKSRNDYQQETSGYEGEVHPETTKIPPLADIKGVIFDMDGTIIEHSIDFVSMRERVYEIADNDVNLMGTTNESERRGDVLELYHSFSEDGQIKAKEVFDDIEAKAIQDMVLMDGIDQVCQFLDDQGIPRAVLTRNVLAGVDAMHGLLWEATGTKEFFPIVSRDTVSAIDGKVLKSKPNPDAILHICNVWNCKPQNVIMIGDSDADDIAAASRAGCGGKVLLQVGGESQDTDSGGGGPTTNTEREERQPSLLVKSMQEFLEVLECGVDV